MLCCPFAVRAQTPDDLVIAQLHIFLVPLGERLLVTEHYVLNNAGAEAHAGELRYPLPVDAQNVQFPEVDTLNERYRLEEGHVIDTLPVPPGEHAREVRISYELTEWAGRALTRTFPLPVEAAVLMARGEELLLDGPALMSMGPLDTEGEVVNAYTVTRPLDADEVLRLGLQVQTEGGAQGAAKDPTLRGLLGVIALAAALGISVWLWRPGRSTTLPETARPLVLDLAELDERFAQGELSETAYREERARLKQSLLALLNDADASVDVSRND
jgi:hypothetical protein